MPLRLLDFFILNLIEFGRLEKYTQITNIFIGLMSISNTTSLAQASTMSAIKFVRKFSMVDQQQQANWQRSKSWELWNFVITIHRTMKNCIEGFGNRIFEAELEW